MLMLVLCQVIPDLVLCYFATPYGESVDKTNVRKAFAIQPSALQRSKAKYGRALAFKSRFHAFYGLETD